MSCLSRSLRQVKSLVRSDLKRLTNRLQARQAVRLCDEPEGPAELHGGRLGGEQEVHVDSLHRQDHPGPASGDQDLGTFGIFEFVH